MNMIVLLAVSVLRLGAPFSDHAVLQCDQPVVVWGAADPKTEVKVLFAGQEKKGRTFRSLTHRIPEIHSSARL